MALPKKQEQTHSFDLNDQMEKAIDALTPLSRLTPATRITFDGSTFSKHRVEDEDGEFLGVEFRRTDMPPLEGLRQSRSPLEDYQYLAGVKFRLDWSAAQISPASGIDYAQAAIYAVDELFKAGQWDGPTGGKVLRSVNSPSDAKLDAMARLGRCADEVGKLSFHLARRIIGEEYTIKQVAAELGVDERYVGPRFRECLDELACHYKMASRQRHKAEG